MILVRRLARSASLLTALFVLSTTGARSEQPRLVKDLRTAPAGSRPEPLGTIDGYSYFRANEPEHGAEIWRSDGTPEGTRLFMDLWAGPGSSDPAPVIEIAGMIYFLAEESSAGRELWRTDGTQEGTFRLGDIKPCSGCSVRIFDRVAVGSRLFFSLHRGAIGDDELWVTDGTREGTRRIATINVAQLTAVGNRLFFRAGFGDRERQLWVSDGTEAGTYLVSPEPRDPSALTEWNDLLFFSGGDAEHGREPWLSDGTASGTFLLKDIRPGTAGSDVSACAPYYASQFKPVALDARLFFSAADGRHGCELWVTDGTEPGTKLFLDAAPPALSESLGPSISQDGRFFFLSFSRLWVTDGTEEGTKRLIENGGWESAKTAASTRAGSPKVMYVGAVASEGSGDRVFFREIVYSDKWGTDSDLWVTDGTSGGTYRLTQNDYASWPWAELNGAYVFIDDSSQLWRAGATGTGSAQLHEIWPGGLPEPRFLADLGHRVLFSADDGIHGRELWSTDGTPAGTSVVLDINQEWYGELSSGLAGVNGAIFFTSGAYRDYDLAVPDRFGVELWKSDGTAAGTYRMQDINPGPASSNPYSLTPVGDRLFFVAHDASDYRLWVTDGTRTGTRSIDIADEEGYSPRPKGLIGAENQLFFFIERASHCEVWKTDGSKSGTRLVSKHSDENSRVCRHRGVLGDLVFFEAEGQLWRTDGSSEGTFALASPSSSVGTRRTAGGLFYFRAGRSLWSTDGSLAGTKRLKRHRFLIALKASGRASDLFFIANDGVNGNSLWTTDGTRVGTRFLKDFRPAGDPVYIDSIVGAVEGTVYFSVTADGWETGIESWLWRSDGTVGGTRPVLGMTTRPEGGGVTLGDVIYFRAQADETGSELWRTDGTPRGTFIVADLNPGSEGSSPGDLTVVGDDLYFVAWTARKGSGIWTVDTSHDPVAQLPKLLSFPGGGGLGDDEFAVLASNLSVLDASSGVLLAEGPFAPSNDWQAVDLDWIDDSNGNTSADIAVLARKREKGRIFIVDGLTGERLRSEPLEGRESLLELEVLAGGEFASVLSRQGTGGSSRVSTTALSGEAANLNLEIRVPEDLEARDLEVIRLSTLR